MPDTPPDHVTGPPTGAGDGPPREAREGPPAGRPGDPGDAATGRVALHHRPAVQVVTLAVLSSVVVWIVGHLGWVLSGFSWATTEAVPVGSSSAGLEGLRITLPLVAAFLPELVGGCLLGSAAAGLLPLAFPHLPRAVAVFVAVGAAAITMVVVTTTARSRIEDGAPGAFASDQRVLDGLVVVVAATTLLGLLLGSLAAVRPGLLPVPLSVVAASVPLWVGGLVRDGALLGYAAAERVADVLVLLLMAAAFVLSVRRHAGWAVVWPVALVVLFAGAPVRIALVQLAGMLRPSAGLPGSLGPILEAALDTFQAAWWDAPRTWWPVLAALVLGVAALVVRLRRTRGRQARPVA